MLDINLVALIVLLNDPPAQMTDLLPQQKVARRPKWRWLAWWWKSVGNNPVALSIRRGPGRSGG